jgi:hypothetical protein
MAFACLWIFAPAIYLSLYVRFAVPGRDSLFLIRIEGSMSSYACFRVNLMMFWIDYRSSLILFVCLGQENDKFVWF